VESAVTDGTPYDLISWQTSCTMWESSHFKDYVTRLTSFRPKLKALMKTPDSFFMYGGLSSYESRKPNALLTSPVARGLWTLRMQGMPP